MKIEKRHSPIQLEEANRLTDSSLLAVILANRTHGMDIPIKDVYKPSRKELDRYVNIDTETKKGAKLLKKAIDNKEHICLITDSDCDGISSASIGALWFKEEHDIDVTVIVNLREYGNGINDTIVKIVQENNKTNPISMIITADHGSSDEDRYKVLKETVGCKILVTDHHLLPTSGRPTSVDAFINPQHETSKLHKHMCGAVVLYMLLRETSPENECPYLFPILGMATVVDMMGLVHPVNRYIVNRGLELATSSLPFKFWLDNKYGRHITPSLFNRGLGPMINSTNRLMVPEVGYEYLTCSKEDISNVFEKMDMINAERMTLTKEAKAIAKLSLNEDLQHNNYSAVSIIPDNEGLIGLVASQLGDITNRPTIVFSKTYESDVLKGSGRAITTTFSMYEIIDRCRKVGILIKGGGHKAAGGLAIKKENFEKFRTIFEDYAKEVSGAEYILWYDMNIPASLLKDSTFEFISRLEPFGHMFEEPRFRLTGKLHKITKTSYLYKYEIITQGEVVKLNSYNKLINSDMLNKEIEYVVSMRKDVRRGVITELLGCALL